MLPYMYILLVIHAQHIIIKFKIIVYPLFILTFLQKTMTQLLITMKYRTPIFLPKMFLLYLKDMNQKEDYKYY